MLDSEKTIFLDTLKFTITKYYNNNCRKPEENYEALVMVVWKCTEVRLSIKTAFTKYSSFYTSVIV